MDEDDRDLAAHIRVQQRQARRLVMKELFERDAGFAGASTFALTGDGTAAANEMNASVANSLLIAGFPRSAFAIVKLCLAQAAVDEALAIARFAV